MGNQARENTQTVRVFLNNFNLGVRAPYQIIEAFSENATLIDETRGRKFSGPMNLLADLARSFPNLWFKLDSIRTEVIADSKIQASLVGILGEASTGLGKSDRLVFKYTFIFDSDGFIEELRLSFKSNA
jgi:hypothetical protein